jgi:hypothetical protein
LAQLVDTPLLQIVGPRMAKPLRSIETLRAETSMTSVFASVTVLAERYRESRVVRVGDPARESAGLVDLDDPVRGMKRRRGDQEQDRCRPQPSPCGHDDAGHDSLLLTTA